MVVRHRADLSVTYDGAVVASASFAEAVRGEPGVIFLPLRSTGGFFSMIVTQEVLFDAERVGTRFGNVCSMCGRFGFAIGPDHHAHLSDCRGGKRQKQRKNSGAHCSMMVAHGKMRHDLRHNPNASK